MIIRPAGVADLDLLAAVTEEMERYYGGTEIEPLDLRRGQIREALFGEVPVGRVLLAIDEYAADVALGFAAYSFLWPAVGLTRSLYLKELYVVQGRRRGGLGRRLMSSLFEIARTNACSRVEWTADHDNAEAQAFYEQFAVEPDSGKLFYRLEQ
jgi:GNAT superfamily N-acetyltransferase